MNDLYRVVGMYTVGLFTSHVWDWWKHSFWAGFKAGLIATQQKGGALTAAERAEVLKKVNADLLAEYTKKLVKVVDVVDQ